MMVKRGRRMYGQPAGTPTPDVGPAIVPIDQRLNPPHTPQASMRGGGRGVEAEDNQSALPPGANPAACPMPANKLAGCEEERRCGEAPAGARVDWGERVEEGEGADTCSRSCGGGAALVPAPTREQVGCVVTLAHGCRLA